MKLVTRPEAALVRGPLLRSRLTRKRLAPIPPYPAAISHSAWRNRNPMTKIRTFMVAALAAIVALGVCAQAHAQTISLGPHLRLVAVATVPTAAVPSETTQEMIGGAFALGVIAPLDGSGNPYWPCLTGGPDADCSSIPSGAWVSGIPYLSWSYSCSGGPCAEFFWWFQDGTVDTVDHLVMEISIKQGKRTVFDTGALDVGPNPYPQRLTSLYGELAFGPGNCAAGITCSNPVTGKATIEATATVGTQTATTRQTIDLN